MANIVHKKDTALWYGLFSNKTVTSKVKIIAALECRARRWNTIRLLLRQTMHFYLQNVSLGGDRLAFVNTTMPT